MLDEWLPACGQGTDLGRCRSIFALLRPIEGRRGLNPVPLLHIFRIIRIVRSFPNAAGGGLSCACRPRKPIANHDDVAA